MSRPRICFFARVDDPATLERVGFYAADIAILRSLGYDVHVASSLRELVPADCYFVWWWGWAMAPVLLGRALRRPVLVTGVFDLPSYARRPAAERLLMRAALRSADANVFCSAMERADIPARFATRAPAHIPLSVDTQLYRPGPGPRGRTVLSVGWLEANNSVRKGMPELIRAAPRIRAAYPDVDFVIAGKPGTHSPVLEALVDELGARSYVRFAGAVSETAKIRLMQECAAYVQPTRHEGFGVAILEAMSCGAPVVTRAVGAVGEVVGDAAALVRDGSAEALADAVIALLADADAREALGRRARARAETVFPAARRAEAVGALIQAALAGRVPAPARALTPQE